MVCLERGLCDRLKEFRISLKCAIKSRSIRTSKLLERKVSQIFDEIRQGMKSLDIDDIKEILRIEIRKQILFTHHIFEDEMNQEHNKFFFKIYYLIMFLPVIIPIIYYYTNLISLELLLYFVCFFPWLFCALAFTCFYNMIHNALRVVDVDKLDSSKSEKC